MGQTGANGKQKAQQEFVFKDVAERKCIKRDSIKMGPIKIESIWLKIRFNCTFVSWMVMDIRIV